MLKKSELFKTVMPTKLLEYMACEKPVVVAVDGQARKLVEESSSGVFVEPGDSQALANSIRALASDAAARQKMGSNGREYIVRHLSREQTARTYIEVLEKLKV